MQIRRTPKFWSVHTHSRYSNNDALPAVEDIVIRAAEMGQKAVGLTDHGNMAGSVELYQACMKHGLKPFPGSELYFVPDIAQHKLDYANKNVKASRYHLGVVAYTTQGYENLVNLSTVSHQQHFHKPLVDFATLAELAENGRTGGLAITSGCYFGYTAQQLIHHGEAAAERFLWTLNEWFPNSVYVELQNHNISHDEEGEWDDERLAEALFGLASRMGLPCVLTQDSHYLKAEDKADHESLKRLVAFGPEADDAVFPGDGFQLADDAWLRAHHSGARLAAGLGGLEDLLSRHRLSIPVLDRYAYAVPKVVDHPQEAMEARCDKALSQKFEGKVPKRYADKLFEEYEVISASDMAGYMMLVAMVTDYMRENDIVFQTRGSAAGSMVCWLLGISNLDPIKWDLRFERFLSKDRTKPPDIDLDIAHDRRDQVISWLDSKFAAHQIGSWALYGMSAEDGEDKGSLLVRYFSRNKYREDGAKTWDEIPEEDRKMLYRLSDRKLFQGMGTNAAGVVITSTKAEFDRLVPLAYMARGGFVTQYSKDDIEALGLVKLDVLGSKTLTVLQKTMENLDQPVSYLDEIPLSDRPTYRLMHTGNTAGIFQLEGAATARGLKQLRPSTIKDVIAAMALFRPAIMKSGGTDAFIKRKHREQVTPVRHELINKVTKDTYGVMLYQEQVIDLLRGLGMEADDLTKFLKAVKASNKDIGNAGQVIKSYQEWIQTRCDELGMSHEDRKFLDEAIAGFAEYGFNRAHASVYGITAYRCAYLAMHSGLEFHAALLAVAAGDKFKEPRYVGAARQRGIRISRADVNVSGASYTVDKRTGAIRRGLQSIKGLGAKSASVLAAMAPYKSLEDLLERTPAQPITGRKGYEGDPRDFTGVLQKLYEAGALDSLL